MERRQLPFGGGGDTDMYCCNAKPAPTATNNFAALLTESNIHGQLVSSSLDRSDKKLTVTYDVYDGVTRWYTVSKIWTLKTDGLYLNVSMTIRNTGWFSEPSIRFKFARGLEFDSWKKYGTPWNSAIKTTDELSGIRALLPADGSDYCQSWDSRNMFIADWVQFSDSPFGITIRVTQNGAGLNMPDAVMEQSIGQIRYGDGMPLGEYAILFTEFWGGNPPTGDRYRPMNAGAVWQHGYKLEVNPAA